MPSLSPLPPVEVPNVNLFSFIFEQKDRNFPEDLGIDYLRAPKTQDKTKREKKKKKKGEKER